MSHAPVWFGPEGASLAGWLHLPSEGTARAGIVLCPATGTEYLVAQPAYRALALRLEAAGFCVVRFDYSSTGDSAGELDEHTPVESWIQSTESALELVRSTGVTKVGLVGLRIGGTLAAVAASRDKHVDALVLWDPCVSGRSFIREHQILRVAALGEDVDAHAADGVELLSLRLPSRFARELAALTIDASENSPADETFLLTRPDRPSAHFDRWLESGDIDCDDADGQQEFIDVEPGISVVPEHTIDNIVQWLDGALPTAVEVVHAVGQSTAIVGRCTNGLPIVERAITFGPDELFGIVSEPPVDRGGPAVILLNVGLLHHVGPGRIWVDLARRWSEQGVRVLRFDLAGIGESPARNGEPEHTSYPPEAVTDVECAMRAVAPAHDSEVVLVGICSGAYHSIETGLARQVRGVGLINPVLYFEPPEVSEGAPIAEHRNAVRPVHGVIRWMRSNAFVVGVAKRPRINRIRRSALLERLVDEWTPEFVWDLLDSFGVVRSSGRTLENLATNVRNTLLVCGKREARTFERSRGRMRSLVRSDRLRYEVRPEIDHSLFSERSRRIVRDLLEDFIAAQFPLSSIPTSGSRAPTAEPVRDEFGEVFSINDARPVPTSSLSLSTRARGEIAIDVGHETAHRI